MTPSSASPEETAVATSELLLVAQRRVLEQLEHADHAVERRADLVAHVGHELRLGLRGGARLGQRPVALGDVGGDRADGVDLARVVAQRELDHQRGRSRRTRARTRSRAPVLHTSASVCCARSATAAGNSSASVLPVPSKPAERGPGAVDEQVAPVAILDRDPRRRVLEDALQPVGRDAQRLGGAPLLGDVGAGGDQMRDRARVVDQARHRPGDQAAVAGGGRPARARSGAGTHPAGPRRARRAPARPTRAASARRSASVRASPRRRSR